MIPYLQDQPFPNPFIDASDEFVERRSVPRTDPIEQPVWSDATRATMSKIIGAAAGDVPQLGRGKAGTGMVPSCVHQIALDKIASLQKYVVDSYSYIGRLEKICHAKDEEIQKLREQVTALQRPAPTKPWSPRLVDSARALKENDAIYRLCSEFSEINTVGFFEHAETATMVCDVTTNDGCFHRAGAALSALGDPIAACEREMRDFLRGQGYGSTQPREAAMGQWAGQISSNAVDKAWEGRWKTEEANNAMRQWDAIPPVSHGQPPQSTQLIGGSQIGKANALRNHDSGGLMGACDARAVAQANMAGYFAQVADNAFLNAIKGVGIDKMWMDELNGTFPDGSKI